MKTMTQIGLNKQAKRFKDTLSHAAYELDGAAQTVEIASTTLQDNVVRINVFFSDAVVGTITNIKLIDLDGDPVAHATRTFVKPATKGLYVAFKYRFVEMEVEDFEQV